MGLIIRQRKQYVMTKTMIVMASQMRPAHAAMVIHNSVALALTKVSVSMEHKLVLIINGVSV